MSGYKINHLGRTEPTHPQYFIADETRPAQSMTGLPSLGLGPIPVDDLSNAYEYPKITTINPLSAAESPPAKRYTPTSLGWTPKSNDLHLYSFMVPEAGEPHFKLLSCKSYYLETPPPNFVYLDAAL